MADKGHASTRFNQDNTSKEDVAHSIAIGDA